MATFGFKGYLFRQAISKKRAKKQTADLDSIISYKLIERKTRKFNPLVIPGESLQQAVPFVSKPINISERCPAKKLIDNSKRFPGVSYYHKRPFCPNDVFYYNKRPFCPNKPVEWKTKKRCPGDVYFRCSSVERPDERKTEKLIQHFKQVPHNKEKKRRQEDEERRKPLEARKAKEEFVFGRKRQREGQTSEEKKACRTIEE